MPVGCFMIRIFLKKIRKKFGTFKTSPYLCIVKKSSERHEEVKEPPNKRHFLCPNMNEDYPQKKYYCTGWGTG